MCCTILTLYIIVDYSTSQVFAVGHGGTGAGQHAAMACWNRFVQPPSEIVTGWIVAWHHEWAYLGLDNHGKP